MKHTADSELRRIRDGIELHQCRRRHTVTHGNVVDGIAIGAAAGSVVVSAGAGEVIFVGSGVKGYGQLVIVRHTPTLVTAYGHNSKIVVQTGDKVRPDRRLLKAGNTEAERPMLRFEVRDRGQPVDPMKKNSCRRCATKRPFAVNSSSRREAAL